jgi:hypothetical protein
VINLQPSLRINEGRKRQDDETGTNQRRGFQRDKTIFYGQIFENGQISFQIRTQMLKNSPRNVKNKFRNSKEKLKCQN